VAGFLIAVFMFTGWDGSIYVNEETTRRHDNPGKAVLIAVVLLTVIYALATSVQTAFTDVVDATGLLYSAFYILTALATIVYYRRRMVARPWDLVSLGVLPLAAAGFLGWIIVKSMLQAPANQNWSILGIVIVGLILMVVVRLVLRSDFWGIQRESGDA
jgi:amino acid transporter